MNKKRWIVASIAVFVVATVLEFIFNDLLLMGIYVQTPQLWRPEADMMKLMPYYWVAGLIAAFLFVYIYAKGYEGKPSKIGEGLRFGLIVGLFIALPMSTICYATMPIGLNLAIGWLVTGIAEYLIIGAVAGLIYKK